MKKYEYKWSIISFLLVVGIVFALFMHFIPTGNPSIDYRYEDKYEDALIVVADYKYPPFSFTDEEGRVQGYDIELVYILTDKMGLNVDLRLM